MPKPSTVPTWATTTNYATNPDPTMVGQPTKVDPGSLTAQGHLHITRPNPRHMNFWQNAVGVWLGWVNTDVFSTEGGSYTLADILTIGGAGMAFNCEVTQSASESMYINGLLRVTGTGLLAFSSAGQADFESGSLLQMLSGSSVSFISGSEIIGDPVFDGGTWTWAKPQVNESTLTNSGSGHIRYRPFALNTSGAQTIGITNGDVFSVPVLVGTLTVTLSTTGAGTGSMMTIEAHNNIASGFSASVTTAEGTYLMRADAGGGFVSSLTVIYRSGAWHTVHAVVVP